MVKSVVKSKEKSETKLTLTSFGKLRGRFKMRMWMIPVACLCGVHLRAEHYEIHKAAGNLRRSGRWATALVRKGFLEPQNFVTRHDGIAEEMLRRGYRHLSPLEFSGIAFEDGAVDEARSYRDLAGRCPGCRKRIQEHLGKEASL